MPWGLGVEFQKGVGPIVQQIESAADLARVPAIKAADRLAPVYETVSRVKAELPKETALIGFAGSPLDGEPVCHRRTRQDG